MTIFIKNTALLSMIEPSFYLHYPCVQFYAPEVFHIYESFSRLQISIKEKGFLGVSSSLVLYNFLINDRIDRGADRNAAHLFK